MGSERVLETQVPHLQFLSGNLRRYLAERANLGDRMRTFGSLEGVIFQRAFSRCPYTSILQATTDSTPLGFVKLSFIWLPLARCHHSLATFATKEPYDDRIVIRWII